MCRNHLRSTWLTFLGLIYILGSADCYVTDDYDDDGFLTDRKYFRYTGEDRGGREPEAVDLGDDENLDFDNSVVTLSKREPGFTPYISLGALNNIQQFFENLKENFKSLEGLPQDERKALLGRTTETESRIFRPPATAAFLHAIRNRRPSHRIKNFVAKVEPSGVRGSNMFSPGHVWTSLGRKR